MKDLKIWLKPESFNVVGFYPYTSIVTCRILTKELFIKSKNDEFIQKFANEIEAKAIALGCRMDNKVVIEIEYINTFGNFTKQSNLFVGYKDCTIAIGLGIWQPDSWTAEHNKRFIAK